MQSSTEIDLSWTNNSQIASGFEILRSDNAGPFVEVDQVDAGTTAYDDASVSPADSAQYEVMATGAGDSADTSGGGGSGGSGGGGSGGNSSPATSPTVVTPTGKPTLAAELGPAISETIVLTWTYAGNDDAGFEIEEYDPAVDANFHLLTPVGAVDASGQGSMNVDGLTGGDTYSFRIRVDRNDGTVSDYSAGSAVTLPIANAPGLSVEPVTIPGDDADPADTELRVGWSGILPGHGVQIEEKSSWIPGNGWSTVWYGDQRSGDWPEDLQAMSPDPAGSSSGDQGFALDPGGSNPGTYIYRIRSTDAYGNPTAWSQIDSGAIPGDSGPAPDAQVSDTTITVSWPATDGRYAVTYGQDDIGPLIGNGATIPYLTGVLSADQSTYTAVMSNLLPGTKYDLVLCTLASSDGTGVPTFGRTSETTAGSAPGTAPAAPDKAWVVSAGYRGSLPLEELIWHNSPDNEDGYIVEESGNANFTESADEKVGADITYLVQPLFGRSPIYCRIAAYRGTIQSGWVYVTITPPVQQVVVLLKGDNLTGITAGPVNAIHESVGLGHYDAQGNIVVDYAWSFGGDGTFRYFGPETQWLGFPFPSSAEGAFGPHGLYGAEGTIYQTDGFGKVIKSKTVTKQQADQWLEYMTGRANPGLKDIYDPGLDFIGGPSLDCVTYSNLEYARAPGGN
jgi:hypothetical protein